MITVVIELLDRQFYVTSIAKLTVVSWYFLLRVEYRDISERLNMLLELLLQYYLDLLQALVSLN